MQAYQSKPEGNKRYLCTTFHPWPVDEIRPKQLLGPNLKALSLLRRRHCSQIVFDESLQVLKVSSVATDTVHEVINAIEGT